MRLDTVMTNYIAYRKALGDLFHANTQVLKSFCRFIGNETDFTSIQIEQVNAFLNGTGTITSFWFGKYNALLGLYRYALSRGIVRTSPLPAVRPKRPQSFVPYIYTREELHRLFVAASFYEKKHGHLDPYMIQTLLLLLYGAGLRLCEALSLRLVDINLGQAILTIRDSKFFTSRLVPISMSLNEKLRQYAAWRLQAGYAQNGDAPFFVKRNGQRVIGQIIDKAFRDIRQEAGVRRMDGARYQPRVHDLRHTFAVHRLTLWYQEGKDVQRLLPHLSVYMGHRSLASTSVYLTMTPDLLDQASQRFEQYALKGGLQ